MLTRTIIAVVIAVFTWAPAVHGQGKTKGKTPKKAKAKKNAPASANKSAVGSGFQDHLGTAGGIYKGVTLYGGGDPPEFKPPPAGIKYVTWPGFQVTDKGTEIFLQISGPVVTKRRDRARLITITMEKTKVPFKNNLRPVITKHFRTPVTQFRLRKLRGDKLRLEIRLRRRSTARVQTRSSGQYTYLVVSFPPLKKRSRRRAVKSR